MGARYFPIVRLSIFIWLVQLLLATTSFAEGLVPFKWKYPKARHYEAASVGEDCAMYRSMKAKAIRQIQHSRDIEARYAEVLVQSRLALESCAKQKGVEDFEDERDEVLVAEICPSFYQAWLKPAARLELLGADIKDAIATRDLMANRLQNYCGHLSSESDDDLGNG